MSEINSEKVTVGPLLSFEAYNLSETLKQKNLSHELVNNVPVEVPQVSFGGMVVNPSDRYLYIVLAKTDYESNQELFKGTGSQATVVQDDPVELRAIPGEEKPAKVKSRASMKNSQVLFLVLGMFLILMGPSHWEAKGETMPALFKQAAMFCLLVGFMGFYSISSVLLLLFFGLEMFQIPLSPIYKLVVGGLALVAIAIEWLQKNKKQKS